MRKEAILQWEKDAANYDPENIEINNLFKLTNFNNKRVLDIGFGLARLTLPISKKAKEVVALDIDKELVKYCNSKKKRKNIRYLLSDIRNFNDKGFDIAVWAQPIYENTNEILKSIHHNLNEGGILVIPKWIDKANDYTAILTPFWKKNKKLMKMARNFNRDFTKNVRHFFDIKKVKIIKTYYSFPNRDELVKNILPDIPNPTRNNEIILNKLVTKYNPKHIRVTIKIYICEKK